MSDKSFQQRIKKLSRFFSIKLKKDTGIHNPSVVVRRHSSYIQPIESMETLKQGTHLILKK